MYAIMNTEIERGGQKMKKYGVNYWYINTFNNQYDEFSKGNFDRLIDAINWAINLRSKRRYRDIKIFEYKVEE